MFVNIKKLNLVVCLTICFLMPISVSFAQTTPDEGLEFESSDEGLEFGSYDEGLESESPLRSKIGGGISSLGDRWEGFRSWIDETVPGHIEVGTRITHFSFKDDTGDFIGSVDMIDERPIKDPTKFFIDWYFLEKDKFEFGIELTWDRIAFNSITTSDGHNDGTINMSGPILALMTRYKFDEKFLPYFGLGIHFLNRTKVDKGWWHHGFPGGDIQRARDLHVEWVAQGKPSYPNGGFERTFTVEDTEAFVAILGVEYLLGDRWSTDFYFRYTDVTVDGEFHLSSFGNVFRTRSTEWPIDNYAFGVGIRYKFS